MQTSTLLVKDFKIYMPVLVAQAFKHEGTFIVPRLLTRGLGFPVSFEGPPHLVASYNKRSMGHIAHLCNIGPYKNIICISFPFAPFHPWGPMIL
jgi:hypothetical protein